MTHDNPPYITVAKLFNVYHVNKMEWDVRSDSYQVSISKNVGCNRVIASLEATQWAEREGLEVR